MHWNQKQYWNLTDLITKKTEFTHIHIMVIFLLSLIVFVLPVPPVIKVN